jgi:hypothetical protein
LSHLRTEVRHPSGGPSARQDLWLTGVIESEGVRWPREIGITMNGAPYFTLTIRSLRVQPRIDDARLNGPP